MTGPRTITVPTGFKAILVSDQLLDRYPDWTLIENVEAKVQPGDELTVSVRARYVEPPKP